MPEPCILLAIEDELLLRTVGWFLQESGFRVLEAPRADVLFEHFATAVPDLLLLDTTAATLPGLRLLEWLKGDERWRAMPVLILSRMPPEDETVRMLGLGAADFIGKPFRVRELLARIQVQLRIRQMLEDARAELRTATDELRQARTEAAHHRELVDIIHEVTGELAPDEIYHILVRRVARALDITHCSLVLAGSGDEVGRVATAYEHPDLPREEVRLDRYPEIRAALERGDFYALIPPRDDIHRVRTTSAQASVSIHLLTNDTGCVWRHAYDPKSGAATPFRSGYVNVACDDG
jgi:two-component system cell cycle response regulator